MNLDCGQDKHTETNITLSKEYQMTAFENLQDYKAFDQNTVRIRKLNSHLPSDPRMQRFEINNKNACEGVAAYVYAKSYKAAYTVYKKQQKEELK